MHRGGRLATAGQHGSCPGRGPARAGQNRPGGPPKISVRPPPVTISQAIKVTKWSTFTGDLNVSEQQAEQTSGEPGSLNAEPAVPASSDTHSQPVAASGADSPDPAPGQG